MALERENWVAVDYERHLPLPLSPQHCHLDVLPKRKERYTAFLQSQYESSRIIWGSSEIELQGIMLIALANKAKEYLDED